jgi:hypothetical protein
MPAKATSEKTQPDYFVVMVDFGKSGREAVVDPQNTWANAVDKVRDAAADGHAILFVHHIHDNTIEDRSEEAFREIMTHLANEGAPLSQNEYQFIELHLSMQAAQSFRREAA